MSKLTQNSESFKSLIKITGNTPDDTKNVKTAVSLKYLSNFWMTTEMPLKQCYFFCSWSNKICNNRCKTYSCCNFIDSR